MPLICFVTRCHPNRPKMRKICITSVASQSCEDYNHLLYHNDPTAKGYGINKADLSMRDAGPLNGEYIMVLDDDDKLVDTEFVKDFRTAVNKFKLSGLATPDIVIFKGIIGGHGVLPSAAMWKRHPAVGHIGSFCFAVKREIWDEYIKFWGIACGDGVFIAKCCASTGSVLWLDRLVATTQRISGGRGE